MERVARLAVLALATALAVVIAGCGGSSGAASSSQAASSSGIASGASSSGASEASAASAASESTSLSSTATAADLGLDEGTYTATFRTDSSMFHVNEANDGKGTLTVSDDGASIHVSLASKKIVNLYPGTADEASQEGAKLLEPTTDMVTYSDGYQEEVYGFDIPVPVLDEEFDVAILGEKGKWYNHKVSVSDPVAE